MHVTYPQNIVTVEALPPAADAAGRSSRWVSMKNSMRAYVKFHINQGNAATITLSVLQATDVNGTGAKPLALAARIFANLTANLTDAIVRQNDGVSFTTDAGIATKLVLIEIDPALLDVNNGYRTIQAVTGPSNAANITEAEFIMTEIRFPQTAVPTFLTN